MNTHCILLGMMGWTSVIVDQLAEKGFEVEYLPKLNALLIYNTTKEKVRRAMEPGFDGGKIIEFEE